ncbi:hypothetical protein [Tannockella kyphosi]|uniref:hypothetical protein n=1 Tax=Tannockella kyphosi TaxID=2899121 RepID=UPI00201110A7|nr:hypothetical protein [Tannockella kyphosi]
MIKKYIYYFIKHNKQFLLIECISALLFVAVLPYLYNLDSSYYSGSSFYSALYVLGSVYIVGYRMFKKHYSKPAMDVYGSLPLKKEKLFLLDGAIGYGIVFLPYICFSIVALFLNASLLNIDASLYAAGSFLIALTGTILYILVYCICSLANSKIDAFLFLGAYTIGIPSLSYLIYVTISRLAIVRTSAYSTGILYTSYEYKGFYYIQEFLNQNPITSMLFDFEILTTSDALRWTMMPYKLAWFVLVVLIGFYTYHKMKLRKHEDILETPKIWWGYPFIICSMLVYSSFVCLFTGLYASITTTVTVLSITLVAYLALLKCAGKPFLHYKTVGLFLVCMSSAFIATAGFLMSNGLGTFTSYDVKEEVVSVSVSSGGKEVEFTNFVDYEELLLLMDEACLKHKEYVSALTYGYYFDEVSVLIKNSDGDISWYCYKMESNEASEIYEKINDLRYTKENIDDIELYD